MINPKPSKVLTKWRRLEHLHHHKSLTSAVKSRLKRIRTDLERKIVLINVLLEKPTKEGR